METNQTKKKKPCQQNIHFTFRLSFISVFSSCTNLKSVFHKQYWMVTKYYSSVKWWCILQNCVLSCAKTKQHQVKEFRGFNAITYHRCKEQSMEEQDVDRLTAANIHQASWFKKISEWEENKKLQPQSFEQKVNKHRCTRVMPAECNTTFWCPKSHSRCNTQAMKCHCIQTKTLLSHKISSWAHINSL